MKWSTEAGSWAWGNMHGIPALQEADAEGLQGQAQPGLCSNSVRSRLKIKTKQAREVAGFNSYYRSPPPESYKVSAELSCEFHERKCLFT